MRVYLPKSSRSRFRRLGSRFLVDVALTDVDLSRFLGRVQVVAAPCWVTGLEAMNRRLLVERLSTGARGLDELLGGGLEAGYLTELVGEFGAGKTQLCHQLAVMVQLPRDRGGLNGRALYVDTEGTFRPERVVSMARYRGLDPEKTLENIIVVEARSEGSLLSVISALRELEVRLIVVDTLIAPLVAGDGVEGLVRRQYSLSRLLTMLREAAAEGRVVVVTNRMSMDKPAGGFALALGCHYGVILRKLAGPRRRAELVRAPHLPAQSALLLLSEEGVVDA
ncbi:MAG: AAA family ATPase [Thermofilaceae archaeon]|nr:AAA family ATPase [Thermofilaceae archaeon]